MKWHPYMLAASMLVPGAMAFAQDATTTQAQPQEMNFDDEIVEGQLIRPDGLDVTGQRHGKASSLIRIREDFIPEMVRSVEDL